MILCIGIPKLLILMAHYLTQCHKFPFLSKSQESLALVLQMYEAAQHHHACCSHSALASGIYQPAAPGHIVLLRYQQPRAILTDQSWLLSHSTTLLSDITHYCNALDFDFSEGILIDFYKVLLSDKNGNSITHSLHTQRY